MEAEEQREYCVDYLVYHEKNPANLLLLQQGFILLSSKDSKSFFKHYTHVDTYLFYVFGENQLKAMIRIKSKPELTSLLFGVDLTAGQLAEKYFCEVEVLVWLAQTGKSKLGVEYKAVFDGDKKITKFDRFLGHKLRDIISYPESVNKKLVLSKTDYLLSKKDTESKKEKSKSRQSSESERSNSSSESETQSQSDSSQSSDSRSSGSSRSRRQKSRKDKKKHKKDKLESKKSKKKRDKEPKSKQKNKSKSRDRHKRSVDHSQAKKKNKDKDKKKKKQHLRDRSRSRERQKSKSQKNKKKDIIKQQIKKEDSKSDKRKDDTSRKKNFEKGEKKKEKKEEKIDDKVQKNVVEPASNIKKQQKHHKKAEIGKNTKEATQKEKSEQTECKMQAESAKDNHQRELERICQQIEQSKVKKEEKNLGKRNDGDQGKSLQTSVPSKNTMQAEGEEEAQLKKKKVPISQRFGTQ